MQNKIEDLLHEGGYSRSELITFLNKKGLQVSRQSVYGYARNKWQPRGQVRRALSEFFDVPVGQLFLKD